jgi:hypothetical protein
VKTFLADVLGLPDAQADIDSCKVEHLISDETGRQLLRFVRWLTTGSQETKELLKRFRRSHAACPKSGTCDICKGHCLVEELARAI